MHLAPLLIFVVCEILLLWAGWLTPLPAWLHLAVSTALAALLLALSARMRRREEHLRKGLQVELSGMQQEVAKAARRYKSLLEGAGNAIFVFNAETGALEEVNRLGTELLGYAREELPSMVGRDLLHADEQEKFRSLVYQIKRRGKADSEGLRFQRKDGSIFLGEIDARLIDLGDEQVVHCILRDVTEKTRQEEEILQRNRELSVLNEVLTGFNRGTDTPLVQEGPLVEIMELFRAEGGTLYLAGQGGAPAELCFSRQVSRDLERLIGDYVTRNRSAFGVVCVNGLPPEEDVCVRSRAEGWGSMTAIPLTAQEHPIGVMHLLHAAPRDYSEAELRFLATVGRQMGNVIETARLFAELSWKSAELLRSHHLLEKTSHNLSVSEAKLKRNLALVEQANLDLSRLDRMKNQFLGMVSHEFNTPLTSIVAGVDHLLQHGAATGDDADVLLMVRDGGMRLKELVADLLKLIRLEARAGDMETSVMHLERLLEGLRERLRPQLEKRRQTVRLTGLDALPFFDADHAYLERVFGELLQNAIRFSPDGGEIEVTGRVTDARAIRERKETLERFNADFVRRCGERCYLEVEVKDHGTGIPLDEQQRIFDIFYEVGEIRHHSSGRGTSEGKGAGLGLAIVKGMVEAHGGMVWVENTGGSSFFLLLPLEQEASQPALF